MTKNHILIKGVVLGVLLSLSPLAKAGSSVDQVLVAYFKKLYPTNPCSIDEAQMTTFLSVYDQKQCLDRRTVAAEGQASAQFIYGFKAPCSDQESRTSLDTQVNAYCSQQAAVKQKAAEAAAQTKQAAAAQQQQQAGANGGSGGNSSGGGNNLASTLGALANGLSDVQKMEKQAKKAAEVYEKKGEYADKAREARDKVLGKDEKAPTATPEIPKVGTSAIYGNDVGKNINSAIAKQNVSNANDEYRTASQGYKAAGCGNGEDIGDCATYKQQMADATQKAKDNGGNIADTDKTIQDSNDLAKKQNNPDVKKEGEDATNPDKPETEDPELTARHAKAKTEDEALYKQIDAIKAKLQQAKDALPQEANSTCTANESTRNITTPDTAEPPKAAECEASKPQVALTCINKEVVQLEKDKAELKAQKDSCSDSSAQAEKLCSLVRSDKAQKVQKMMSIGGTILSKVTAASESCGVTSDLSKIAQGGILAAQGSCIAMKVRCDLSCKSAKGIITKMKVSVEAIKKCQASALLSAQSTGKQVDAAAEELAKTLSQELQPEKSVPSAIAQCEKHKTDIATMGLAALGFLSAFQDADSCKKQLAAGGGNKGNGGTNSSSMVTPTMTTAEYCAIPSNASSITCKCTANPSAEGCMGSMAGSGVALGKIGSGSGASGFASAKQNGLGAIDPLGKSTNGSSSDLAPGANLSEGAREALGIGSSAGLEGGSGGGSQAGAANSDKTKNKATEEKEKKTFGFFSSIGNMLSGGKSPSTAAKAAIRGYEQDQAIKRKLASDQVRAEITTASGKSNFDKIKSRYQSNVSSFEQ